MSDLIIKSTDIAERIRLNVQQSLINIVPTEQWDKVIKETIDNYITTDLPNIIKIEVQKKFKSIIKEYLNSPEFNVVYGNNGKIMASKAVKEMMKEMSGDILASLFGGAIQQAVDSVKYNLQNYGQ